MSSASRTDVGTVEDLKASAVKAVGLDDFGTDDDNYIEALSVLLDAYRTEADFTELGSKMSRFFLRNALVARLLSEASWKQYPQHVDVPVTAHMVDSVYRFRGLGDPKVFLDANTAGLLTNYSSTNFRLAAWAQDSLQKVLPRIAAAAAGSPARAELEAQRDAMANFAEKYLNLNARILPTEWRVHYYAGQLYQQIGKTAKADSAFIAGMNIPGPNAKVFAMNLAQSYMKQGRVAEAKAALATMVKRFPDDLEVAFALSEIDQQSGDLAGARDELAAWLSRNPSHQYAQAVQQQIQQMDANLRNAPSAPQAPSAAPGIVPAPAK